MDPLLVIIILAIGATLVATILGLITMSGGGATDQELSTPLMWARVGLQALTLLLLLIAVLLHRLK
jgi:hypothetical protein